MLIIGYVWSALHKYRWVGRHKDGGQEFMLPIPTSMHSTIGWLRLYNGIQHAFHRGANSTYYKNRVRAPLTQVSVWDGFPTDLIVDIDGSCLELLHWSFSMERQQHYDQHQYQLNCWSAHHQHQHHWTSLTSSFRYGHLPIGEVHCRKWLSRGRW